MGDTYFGTLSLGDATKRASHIAKTSNVLMAVVCTSEDGAKGYEYCPAAAYDTLFGVLDRAKLAHVAVIINVDGKEVWRNPDDKQPPEIAFRDIVLIMFGNAYRLNTDPNGDVYLEDAPVFKDQSIDHENWGPVDIEMLEDADKRKCRAIQDTLNTLFDHVDNDWDTRY